MKIYIVYEYADFFGINTNIEFSYIDAVNFLNKKIGIRLVEASIKTIDCSENQKERGLESIKLFKFNNGDFVSIETWDLSKKMKRWNPNGV